MSDSYSQVFGGETVNPAQLSYIAYTSSTTLILHWPFEAAPDDNVAADKIDVTMTMSGRVLQMPPANQISVGQDVLVRNTGSFTFSVRDGLGAEIGSIAAGEAWYFVVINNETIAGDWYAIEFGVGTSSATAASLAGAGLRANVNKLDQNLLTNELTGDYAITETDRATVLQSEGGAVTFTFASAATLGDGWFSYIINAGTGSLTLDPAGGQTIDGLTTKVLAPRESLIVFCDGAEFHTVGYGRSIVNTITGVNINAAGLGTTSLTAIQLAAQIQDYVGTLTGARIFEYGGAVGYWFVYNNTSGAFDLTLRVDSLDPGAGIPQGSFSIVRSNGTNMDIAFTAASGTVTSVGTGAGLTGGPITSTGTISMLNTTVVAGAYGASNRTITLTVNSRGQLTGVNHPFIAIQISQVAVMTSNDLRARVSDSTGNGSLVFAQGASLGTPITLDLTNAVGLPLATGITGFGANVIPFLTTPSSANLATAVTDETGTGALVFASAPTLVNPVVGTQAAHDNSTKAASTAYVDRVAVQQIVSTAVGTGSTTAGTAIPIDNSRPINTEGDEVLTLAITPNSTTSTLVIDATVVVTPSLNDTIAVALFQDATVNALSCVINSLVTASPSVINMRWTMTSGTVSATTFKIRIGANSAQPLFFNSDSGGQLMGGSLASGITITEYGA